MATPVAEPLVGRARELAQADAALQALREGQGGFLLVTGEAGIGKTRLAGELAGRALAAGTAVVWGRCVEGDGAPPYWPWRQVVRALDGDPDEVFGGPVEAPDQRFRVVDQVRRLLTARGPLVVVVDDVHVADEASATLLRHLVDGLLTLPVLVVATAREVSPALSEAQRAAGADRWELRRLEVGEVQAQLSAPERAAEVHRVTGGNPMFVREIARAIAEGTWDPERPPRTVVDAVAARLERLSASTRAALETAAVLGRDLDLDVLAEAHPDVHLSAVLDEATAHGFVDGRRFVHALTRDAVVQSVPPSRRADLHRTAAAALAAAHADRLDDHLAELVGHAQAAGDSAAVVRWGRRGAEEAARRLAFEEAARLYRLAAQHAPDDASLLHGLARSAYLAGDLPAWVQAVRRAADLARDPAELAAATLLLETVPEPAVNALIDELCGRLLAAELPDPTRARLLALHSRVAFYASDPALTDARSAEALALAVGDDTALVAALRARWEALPGPAGRAERRRLADAMVEVSQRLGSAWNELWGRLWQVEVRVEVGEVAAATDLLPPLRAAADRVGGPVAAWHTDRIAACVAQMSGRYAEAAELSARALGRMLPIEPAPAQGAWFAMQYALSRHVAVPDRVLEVARAGWATPPQFRTMAHLSRALVLVGGRDLDAGRAQYLQAGAPESWRLPVFFVVPGRVVGLLTSLALGLLDDAAVLVDLLDPLRDEMAVGGGVSCLGPVELALGRAELALGRADRAETSLRRALATAERCGLPGFAVEAQLLLAELAPAEAARLRRAAGETVRALGMTRLAPPPVESPLSAREQEVAALVAEGLSNRQIAERLFLSERTAQNHVQHILTKLDLSNRAQVAAWWMSR